ncbi:EAL domain-containing protein [Ketobacter sp. MCCC 1A13808]|nr:EAL domain-containing protein [Ketobacter sp. MCCC 1A13808]
MVAFMNSSLVLHDTPGIGTSFPNYVFVADQHQQFILYSNLSSPHNLLKQDSLETDLYQAHLNSLSTNALQLRNVTEDLIDVIVRAHESSQGYLFRFRDEGGYWRFGYLENVTLYGGANGGTEHLCGIILLLQNPASYQSAEIPPPSRLVWMTDLNLRLVKVGSECRSLGFDMESLLANGQLSFLTDESSLFLETVYQDQFSNPEPETRVVRLSLRSLNGSAVAATIQFSLLFDGQGTVTGTLGIADFYPSREVLESERQLFSAMFESISEGLFVTDRSGFILRANPAFYELTGYQAKEILGMHCQHIWKKRLGSEFFREIRNALVRNRKWRGECEFVHRDGSLRYAMLSFSQTHNMRNEVRNYVGVLMDIGDKKRSDLRIHRLAYYDPLTGIANRRLFNERLSESVTNSERNKTALAVLFLDLDRFKPVNDSLGHVAGDQLLKGVARRLVYCLREGDTVARMGGDEFALILHDLEPAVAEQTAIKMASRVVAQFYSAFMLEGREVYTSPSIGISLYPHHGQSAGILLRGADTAMYAAKRAGKNHYQFYDEVMNKRAMDRLIMENAMRRALLKEEFELYFQPQYAMVSGVMTGIEVLLRWDHPQFGSVRPLEFIHLAEQTDLIIPLGEWVFQQTCEKISEWQKSGVRFPRVGVNVSANQFKREDFADWALFQVQRYGVNPAQLEIEITESAIMDDVEHSLQMLERLQKARIRIAVDDFGTGYSSLNYLRKFPISTLKIDRVFVEDIVDNQDTLELTQTIIAIAKSLNLGVIAEGVETRDQYQLLTRLGCNEVQGYFMSPALSESKLLELVAGKSG